MEKTLTILIGNARGGEETWETMYRHLLAPYKSDLALCFGETDDKSASLYARANYVWDIPEYGNWRDYFAQYFPEDFDRIFIDSEVTGIMGGIDDARGSGAIIFAFRDFILRNKAKILLEYDRIILTRSDHYYLQDHPLLPLGNFHLVEGEDYGGVTDRHHIFDSGMLNEVLGICEFICSRDNFPLLMSKKLNPERALLEFFRSTGIEKKINRFKRVQFTVADVGDLTRWRKAGGGFSESKSPTLMLKYEGEYIKAKENLKVLYWLKRRLKRFCSKSIRFLANRVLALFAENVVIARKNRFK